MAKITDENSAREWLRTQPHQVQVWIAARAALRAVPSLYRAPEVVFDRLTLVNFRTLIISSAAALVSAEDMKELKDLADFSVHISSKFLTPPSLHVVSSLNRLVNYTARSIVSPKVSTDIVAESALSMGYIDFGSPVFDGDLSALNVLRTPGAAAAYAAVNSDAQTPGQGWPPLWPDGTSEPKELRALWPKLRDRLLQDEPTWGFWVEWYEALLKGNPPQSLLNLTIAIAKQMTVGDWEAGPKHVAQRIGEIKARLVSDLLPQAEDLQKSETTGLYDVVTVAIIPEDMLRRIVDQTRFALDTAMRGNSGLNDFDVAARYIRHACEVCPEDTNTVEQHFTMAAKSLRRGLETGKFDIDSGVPELAESLERHALQLRADHPDVGQAWTTRAAQRLREIGPEVADQAYVATKEYAQTTEGRLRQETDLDAETLASNESPEVKAEALKRSGERAAKQSLKEKIVRGVDAVDKSATVKGSKAGLTAYSLVDILWKLLG